MSMAFVYFGINADCDGRTSSEAWLCFIFTTQFCLIVEIWIASQCKIGYCMFRDLKLEFFVAMGFGRLGHFDSFTDILNTKVMAACEEGNIDHFRWFSVWGHKFDLPTDLATMMIFGLVMVVALQALPGIVLLACKKVWAVSLKFNEFTVILWNLEVEMMQQAHNKQEQ